MRRFIDFWIKAETLEESITIIKSIRKLGFTSLVMELGEDVADNLEELKSRTREYGVSIYRKLVLKPERRRDLLKSLQEHRGKFEAVTVLCENLETALVAARDSRVDTLVIPPKPKFRFDKGVAALIKNRIELPFIYFLEHGEAFLETSMKIMEILGRKIEIVVSSGASNELDLRGPRELASLLEVLGYDQERALDAVSKTPEKILETNRIKLSKKYAAKGVIKLGEEI
ncbi:MAG: hypothetical protein N3F65_02230 [Nitrososphaeria archaeon]|nr:hypothetical protein [Nitrososphaeria archaeon]